MRTCNAGICKKTGASESLTAFIYLGPTYFKEESCVIGSDVLINMMLCVGPLGTIYGQINLCMKVVVWNTWLYTSFKYSSTLRKIYILWIKICISLNVSHISSLETVP